MKQQFQRAIDFAASVNAKVTLPTEPRRPMSLYEKVDVAATWARFKEEPDFITGMPMVERRMSPEVWAGAPESWRSL